MGGVGGSGFNDLSQQQAQFNYSEQAMNQAVNQQVQQYSDAAQNQQTILGAITSASAAEMKVGQEANAAHQSIAKGWSGEISSSV